MLVDPATGQTYELAARIEALQDQIAGAERDLNGWRTRHANLLRDREADARETELWPAALRVFDHWRKRCNHPKAEWTMDRFEMVRPFLERSNTGKGKATKLTAELLALNEARCMVAVEGIAFDPFKTKRKNGTWRRHDGWHLIFGEADQFEERVKAAPREAVERFMPAPPEPKPAATPPAEPAKDLRLV